jgi:branched-chain amino acid aminotransferase
VVCDLAREEEVPVEAGRYSPNAVREASEAFLASAAEGIRPISRLDGIAVGDGPVTRLLAATLEKLIETEYHSDRQ